MRRHGAGPHRRPDACRGLDQLRSEIPEQTRHVYLARYIDWSITTPLLLTALCTTALGELRRRPALVVGILFSDIAIMGTGLAAALSHVQGSKVTWYLVSCAFQLAVYALISGPLRGNSAPPAPPLTNTAVHTDIAIVGAGCAGLSVAARLADAGPRVGRVVVLDARTTFGRDRTWCFWNVHAHPFHAAVTHQWSRWRVVAPDGTDVVRTSARYAYQHVPADAFYAEALARIARAPHIELRLDARVDAVADSGGAVRVYSAQGELRAGHVFDSRPDAVRPSEQSDTSAPRREPRAAHLVQAFAGAVVHAERPVFDAGAATLMDFTVDQWTSPWTRATPDSRSATCCPTRPTTR